MFNQFRCKHCRQIVKSNPGLKGNQEYCGKKECQQARKTLWHHRKMNTDKEYQKKRADSQKKWRKKKPSDQYMKQYRESHPEYVKANRQKQGDRNQRRKQSPIASIFTKNQQKIVKMNSLSVTPSITNTYQMTALKEDKDGKIVKMDTLIVQLHQIQGLRRFNQAVK